jgi:site-specific DNA recombinase
VTGLRLRLESLDRDAQEVADVAVRAFKLSQRLREKWVKANYAAKRTILSIIAQTMRLNSGKLEVSLRNPFDVLASGLVLERNGAMGI